MVISLSGYDGMGKSTSVDLLMEKICENHGLAMLWEERTFYSTTQ